MSAVRLEHPGTGRGVAVVHRAELRQRCRICHTELHGFPIASVAGATTGGAQLGWFHLSHLEGVLAAATPARRRRGRHLAEAGR